MRSSKAQNKISVWDLVDKTVAVRVWDSSGQAFACDIVKVAEVSWGGDEFASFDGSKWTEYCTADIIRVFWYTDSTDNKKQKGKSMHPIVEEFPLGHPITDEFPTEGLETPSILYYLD